MNENKQTLLFELLLDIPGVEENAKKALASLASLRAEKEKTQKVFGENLIGEATYQKTMQALAVEIDKTEKELASYVKTIDNSQKVQTTATVSVVKMGTNLATLASQETKVAAAVANTSKNLTVQAKTLAEVTKAGDGFKSFVDSLNDKLTYQKTVTDASALSMDELGKVIANLEAGYEGLTAAERKQADVGGVLLKLTNNLNRVQQDNKTTMEAGRKTVTDYIKGINVLGINIGETITSFREGGIGIKTFTSSIFTARGALVALTAVPIIAVLSGLYLLLTKTQGGMDFLAKATGSLSAIFNVLIRAGADLGRAFIQLFTAPTEAIASFKRILSGLPADVSAAAQAGAAVVEANAKIEDSERRISLERAKNRAEIAQLKKITEDTSKSIEERTAAAQKAYELENKTLQDSIAVQKQRLQVATDQFNLGQKTRADAKELAEEQIKLDDLVTESTEKQIELQNKKNELQQEGIRQRVTSELAATNQEIANVQQAGGAREGYYEKLRQLQEQQLEQQFKLDTIGLDKKSTLYKAMETKLQADIALIRYQSVLDQANSIDQAENDALATRLAKERQGSIAYLKIQKEQIDQENTQQVVAATRTIKIKEDLDAALDKLDQQRVEKQKAIDEQIRALEIKDENDLLEARLAMVREGSSEEYQIRTEMHRKTLKDALYDEKVSYAEFKKLQAQTFKQLADDEKQRILQRANSIVTDLGLVADGLDKLNQARTQRDSKLLQDQHDAALKSAGLSAEERTKVEEKFAAKKEELDRKAAERSRRIATVQNIIATAQGITQAFTQPFPFNIIQAALVATVGAAQQAVIASQQFARGGIIDGPSHAQGGVKYRLGSRIVELEGGEGVVNKRSMALPGVRQQVSEINQRGGGVAYPGTQTVAVNWVKPPVYNPIRFDYGGIVNGINSVNSNTNVTATIDQQALGRTVSKMVIEAVKALPAPVTRIVDINQANDKLNRVENRVNK